jgi:hypothetical protein
MTDQTSPSIDDVRALVAERHRFDEWLAALEARRADTPEHVYSRVHGDYVARRALVLTQLHAHAPALDELLAGLDARVTDLEARMGAEEDERAEAMLRHAVGEYDDATWDEVRERVESSLAGMRDEHGALDAQREDVRGLLAQARPDPQDVGDEAPVAADADSDAPGDVASDMDSATADVALLEVSGDDLIDGLDAPAAPEHQAQAVETAATPSGDAADEVRPGSITETLAAIEPDVVDEPSSADRELDGLIRPPMSSGSAGAFGRPGLWGSRTPGLPDAASDAAETELDGVDVFGDANSSTGLAPDGAGAAGSTGAAPAGAPPAADAFDELAFLRSVIDPQAANPVVPKSPGTGAPQKTLRCTECGTMNLPTEWYCERCGGELAAF